MVSYASNYEYIPLFYSICTDIRVPAEATDKAFMWPWNFSWSATAGCMQSASARWPGMERMSLSGTGQGKPTLVPESNKRPVMNTAKNDFIEENDHE